MSEKIINADIIVIGAGSAGLSVAAGASQLGASTVLIEGHKMGGDCLNTGCVPSKALLAAAKAARRWEGERAFGVTYAPPSIDFAAVNRHVHEVIAAIAPNDSVERFEGLGVKVIEGTARFVGPREVAVDGARIRARRIVIATGSGAAVPPIPGLDRGRYFTNETVFYNAELPRHLIVIGGGPIGLEMAQAHRALGSEVTVLEASRVLPKDDPELSPRCCGSSSSVRASPSASRSKSPASSRRETASLRCSRPRAAARSGSPARTFWSPPEGDRTSPSSISRKPASSSGRAASRSMRGCAPPTGAPLRSATSPAVRNSPTSRAITPAS